MNRLILFCISLLSTVIAIIGCERDEAKLIKDIAGSWQIKKVTYSRTLSGKPTNDSVVNYTASVITFEKCKGGCDGSYRLNGLGEVPFYYYVQPTTNGLSINVGRKTGPGINPPINLNGQAYILEHSSDRMLIDFDVIVNKPDGSPQLGSYRAKAVLER